MKRRLLLFAGILLLYLVVRNTDGISITSIEMLTTGYDKIENKMYIYLVLLNIGTMSIFISMIEGSLSSAFQLRNYIGARSGLKGILFFLIRVALKNVLIILCMKQVVYFTFYMVSFSFTGFYIYDMISTFLTLTIISLILIIAKINNIRTSIAYFMVLSLHVVCQFLSYKFPIVQLAVIASVNWENMLISMFVCKSIIIVALIYGASNLKSENTMIGVIEA